MPEGPKTDFAAAFLNHCSQTTLKDRVILGIYGDIKKPVSPKKNKKLVTYTGSESATFETSNDKQGDNQGSSSLEDFLKAATGHFCHLHTHKNIWPDPKVIPELANDDSYDAFLKADLKLIRALYHQRWYILEFPNHRFFSLQPNLHTSINLYTRKVWDQQIVPLPAAGRGFCIGIVFDFGDYILSFNSRDCLFEISWCKCKKNPFPSPLSLPYSATGIVLDHPVDNETLLQAYHLWLSSAVRFSGKHWLSMEPVWVAIKNDHAVFDAFGMYATSILCFLVAFPTVRSPSVDANLGSCSMPFKNGAPLSRLKRALSYDHISLCATLEDQISYKEDLLLGHLWHLIVQNVVTVDEKYQDPVSSAFRPRFRYVKGEESFDCDGSCHLLPDTISDSHSRKKQRMMNLYNSADSSGIWTLYRIPSNVGLELRWVAACDFEKECKLLEVIKRTKSEWVVGPLDFCGVSLVQNMGNGRYIHYVKYLGDDDLNPAPLSYRLIQDMKYHVMPYIPPNREIIKMTKKGTPILQSKYAKLVHLRRVQAQDRHTKARQIFKARRKHAEKELLLVRCGKKAKPSVLRNFQRSDSGMQVKKRNGKLKQVKARQPQCY
ncbi:hypothetical protein EV421DRAFT_1735275 [Armillaria borealis]|uniref:Uncharacterized protein n=1 Tax=Armillaria borealis TaxID=47425 RepID=A0AA39JKM4_9AGAR|nr:hypothetical protein EV421DRAFT_1735275 [Armillaria borealis]